MKQKITLSERYFKKHQCFKDFNYQLLTFLESHSDVCVVVNYLYEVWGSEELCLNENPKFSLRLKKDVLSDVVYDDITSFIDANNKSGINYYVDESSSDMIKIEAIYYPLS